MKKKTIIFSLISVSFLLILGGGYCYFPKNQKTPVVNDPIPFSFEQLSPYKFPKNNCPLNKYGAIPDGKTINTQAFEQAIADCSGKGGGTISVPAGNWLTGPIHLKGNLNLYLDKAAIVIFTTDPQAYLPVVLTRFEGIDVYNFSPLIYIADAENVAITGPGKFDGQGQTWMPWKDKEPKAMKQLYAMMQNDISVAKRIFGDPTRPLRPSFIQTINAKNIRLEDFTITNSPRWTIHPIYSDKIAMRNLTVETSGFNSDGIVIDSSTNVLIEDCRLNTGDDTIAIKSGLDKDGWRVNKPAENIVIRNCTITGGHSAIAIGSEMSGGVKNIFLSNLTLDGIDQGIRSKSLKGRGGIVENIWAKNIKIGTAKNAGLKFDLNYDASTLKPSSDILPTFQNFDFENISVENTKVAVSIEGIPGSYIKNVRLKSLQVNSEEGIFINYSEGVSFIDLVTKEGQGKPIFEVQNSQNISY